MGELEVQRESCNLPGAPRCLPTLHFSPSDLPPPVNRLNLDVPFFLLVFSPTFSVRPFHPDFLLQVVIFLSLIFPAMEDRNESKRQDFEKVLRTDENIVDGNRR